MSLVTQEGFNGGEGAHVLEICGHPILQGASSMGAVEEMNGKRDASLDVNVSPGQRIGT